MGPQWDLQVLLLGRRNWWVLGGKVQDSMRTAGEGSAGYLDYRDGNLALWSSEWEELSIVIWIFQLLVGDIGHKSGILKNVSGRLLGVAVVIAVVKL